MIAKDMSLGEGQFASITMATLSAISMEIVRTMTVMAISIELVTSVCTAITMAGSSTSAQIRSGGRVNTKAKIKFNLASLI